jgi:ATP-dependent exoDNAse (exonuclease V) alpha subunit
MAIFHLNLSSISRARGRTATAASAYRSGEKITDARTGITFDYTKRQKDILASGLLFPESASVKGWNRSALWNAAEEAKRRKNSCVAKEITIAIPAELNQKQAAALVAGFGKWLVTRYGCAVDFALHAPNRKGDGRNTHAHLLMTDRRLTSGGFGEKIRELTDRTQGKQETEAIRQAWEKLSNNMLLLAEQTQQIDRRSLAAQGIAREPTRKVGVAAMAMERRGIKTELAKINRAIAEANEKVQREVRKHAGNALERARSFWKGTTSRENDQRRQRVISALSEAPENGKVIPNSAHREHTAEKPHATQKTKSQNIPRL